MEYVNLTKRDIKIYLGQDKYLELPKREDYIGYSFNESTNVNEDGIMVTKREYIFKNIPPEQTDTIYIVDVIVKRHYLNRLDFYVTNNSVYDKDGNYLYDNGIRFDN